MTRTRFAVLGALGALILTLFLASSAAPQEAKEPPPQREPKVKTVFGSQTLAQAAVQELTDAQVDLIETELVAALTDQYFTKAPNDDLRQYLQARPDLQKQFILAIDPKHDDLKRVFDIFLSLVNAHPREAERYPHLFIAFAVVYDDPKMPRRPRILGSDVPPPPSMEDSLDYYLKTMGRMLYPADNMRWPFLIHVVDCDLPIDERLWALKEFASRTQNLAGTYASVPYDMDKIRGEADLAGHPYVLPNLKKYGGICVDQAYFASRVCKAFGVPAQDFGGMGNSGIGHAWVGFFTIRRNQPYLDFYGRYRYSFYYVGRYPNPQTGQRQTDREMELIFAAAGRSYVNMIKADSLLRVAKELYKDDPDTSIALAQKATKVNPYVGDAWKHLAQAVADARIAPREGQKLFDQLMKSCSGFPDLVFDVFLKFLGPWEEKTWKNRMTIYDRAYVLFDGRPDLQILLREQQGDELVVAGNKDFALQVYGRTAQALPKEGARMIGLAQKAEAIFRERGQLANAVIFYESIIRFTPRKRMETVCPAYQQIAGSLIRLCDEIGDQQGARKWRRLAEVDG